MTQGYLFVAFGERFVDECTHQAHTIRKHGDTRPFSILTDNETAEYVRAKDLFEQIHILQTDDPMWNDCTNEFERRCLYPRITLNRYLTYDETITTDSDILCQSSPEHVWSFCSNRSSPVTTVGKPYDPTWHWNTIGDIWKATGLHVPHVNGGFKYVRKGEFADQYYAHCADIFWNYDDLGCKRWFRDSRTEEVVFAIAHGRMGILPVDFREYPIETFDYKIGMEIPSKLQNEGWPPVPTMMNGYPPFVHMTDKLHGPHFQWLYKTIMGN